MVQRLVNKVALVTGASSRIGRAACLAFAKEGAKVVLASRNEANALQTLCMMENCGGEGLFIKTDTSVERDVENVVQKALETYGHLDCAFNNARISGPVGSMFQLDEQDFQHVLDIYLKGLWLCMKYELAVMLVGDGGSIVNMSSIAGLLNTAYYTSSKFGVVGLTKVAALEYAKSNVRINAICPNVIDHPVLIDQRKVTHPEVNSYFLGARPVGRIGQPEEIANAVIWLCSEESSFVTGVAFPVDSKAIADPIPQAQ